MKLPISKSGNSHWTVKLYWLFAGFNYALTILFREIQRILPLSLSLFLYSPRQFEKTERFPIFHIHLETYFQVCISQRPLACYVMALSRQTARTFPGHRTSINYRSFHEQLHRFWKLPVFTRYSASRKNANRKHGKCWIRRQVSGN